MTVTMEVENTLQDGTVLLTVWFSLKCVKTSFDVHTLCCAVDREGLNQVWTVLRNIFSVFCRAVNTSPG